jgi:hypothetical protein
MGPCRQWICERFAGRRKMVSVEVHITLLRMMLAGRVRISSQNNERQSSINIADAVRSLKGGAMTPRGASTMKTRI